MKSKRFSVEQIVSAIKQHEAGLSIAEIARKMGIAAETMEQAQLLATQWFWIYNNNPPNSAIGRVPPRYLLSPA